MYVPIYLDFKPVFKPQPLRPLPADQNDLDLLGRTVITDNNYILEIEPPVNCNSDIGLIQPFEVRVNRNPVYDLKLRLELPPSPANDKFSYNDCYKVSYYSWYKVLSPLTRQIVMPNTAHKKFLHTEYWYVWDTKTYVQNTVTFFKDLDYGFWLKQVELFDGFKADSVKRLTVPYSQTIDLTQYPYVIDIQSVSHSGGQVTGYQIKDTSAQHIPSFLDVDPLYPFELLLDFSEADNLPELGDDINIDYFKPLTLEHIVVPYIYE